MFSARKPSHHAIEAFLRKAQAAEFSYPDVGASRQPQPLHGYDYDRHRIRIGCGEADFARAASNVRAWRMFDLGWVAALPPDTPIAAGATVVIIARAFRLWSLHACRIVYVLEEETAAIRRFGFAYGTLTLHAERGEERFCVEWERQDDSVWYDILAFSRPAHWLARLAYPLSRRLQRRFARDSMRAMAQ